MSDSDDVRRAVVWLLEQVMGPRWPRCNRCGHGQSFHRHDDASEVPVTDPAAEFRCVWPAPDGPPVALCDCPDWVPYPDDPTVPRITGATL